MGIVKDEKRRRGLSGKVEDLHGAVQIFDLAQETPPPL